MMTFPFKKRLRQLLVDMSWYAQLVPPESIKETASATLAASDSSTDTYRTCVVAKPYTIPASRLVVKKVRKRKRKPKYAERQNYEDQGE